MEKTIKNILVPINFSNSSANAVQVAIAMCKRHDASLHLLKVNQENVLPYPSGKNALLIGIRLESRAAELNLMESQATRITETHNIECYYHVEDGAFSKTVAKIADDFYCDLIVIEKKIKITAVWFIPQQGCLHDHRIIAMPRDDRPWELASCVL